MASSKPKKAAKKSSDNKTQPEKTGETSAVVTTATATKVKTVDNKGILKGFFARKYGTDENILTIFKTPKIWGALIGEAIGTMLLTMFLLTLGMGTQVPSFFVFCMVGVYIAVVGLSGANLNPLITAGMMASRRMSAIRGVLYMLAQVLGAWIGLIIINAFRLGSGTTQDLPMMTEVTGETFWAVMLIELMGAIIFAFGFARALKFARKSPLTFAFTVSSIFTLIIIVGVIVAQGYFTMESAFMFNPAVALMYQVLPTAADNFGELAAMAGLAIAAYIVVPMVGGILGFYLSDITTRLACGGYLCACDDEAEAEKQK